MALLKVERVPAKSVVAKLGDSDTAAVGDQVFIVGAPAGMSYTMTVGHISANSAGKGYPSEALRTIHPLFSRIARKSNGCPEQRAPGAAGPRYRPSTLAAAELGGFFEHPGGTPC